MTIILGTLNLKKEAEAAISLNPNLVWAEAVITDDRQNGNNMRIPREEFQNIVKTGVFTPLKLDVEPAGHKEARGKPIGTFTAFSERETGDSAELVGLIALWPKEREEAVNTLNDMLERGELPQISWEVDYGHAEKDENGVKVLRDVVFNGAAVVNNPAYRGRTPIFAMAEMEDNKEMEELQEKLKALEAELEQLRKENEELKQFQAEVEAQAAKIAKMQTIKEKFQPLNKDDSFFDEHQEELLGLSESTLDFMMQEMLAFASKEAEAKAEAEMKIPVLQAAQKYSASNPKMLGQAYINLKKNSK